MNSVIVWIMVAASTTNTSPTVIAHFATEAQCETTAAQLAARADARRTQPGRWFARLDAVCVPAAPVK